MKKHLLFFMLVFGFITLKAQTVMVLTLPNPCNGAGVDEYKASSFLVSAFPNPAEDKLTLKFSDLEPVGKIEVTLTDVSGRVVKKTMFYSANNNLQTEIDIKDLVSGVYFMESKGDGKRMLIKIIKK